ncbi:MAG TPA: acyl-CoA dehydrogenase, partial [Leeuwenhoekiella sp.]|nr:acyl-CoA dehydrogenase [Leeuwenhoekiella sp.]
NFRVFADLTLWINYIGMVQHYLAEASKLLDEKTLEDPHKTTTEAEDLLYKYANEVEAATADNTSFSDVQIEALHTAAAASVKRLSKILMELHPLLGIKAARVEHPLNQIFRDYFTATQHHIFTR